MEFGPQDHPNEKALKLDVVRIYNAKLDERERRKRFVIERNLVDFHKSQVGLSFSDMCTNGRTDGRTDEQQIFTHPCIIHSLFILLFLHSFLPSFRHSFLYSCMHSPPPPQKTKQKNNDKKRPRTASGRGTSAT